MVWVLILVVVLVVGYIVVEIYGDYVLKRCERVGGCIDNCSTYDINECENDTTCLGCTYNAM